jgi:hypothetical protein
MCIFKGLAGYTDYGGYENRNSNFFNNNQINDNEKLMLTILNCTLLYDQMMAGLYLTTI